MNEKEVQFSDSEDQKPNVDSMIVPQQPMQRMNEYMQQQQLESSESMPKWHATDSSSSEHVLSSSSPEFVCDKEVESQPKWNELDAFLDNTQLNFMDGFQDNFFNAGQMQYNDQFPLFSDMYAFMQKPF